MGFPRTRVIAALVVSLVLTGCGGQSDTAKIKQTLTRALNALAKGDGATLCSLATKKGRASLAQAVPGSSCQKVIQLVSARLSPALKTALESVKVGKVTVQSNHATVPATSISSSHGSLRSFLQAGGAPTTLTKESDGNWKISG